jgi:hypothetical protein
MTSTSNKDLKKYWLFFGASLLFTVALLFVIPEWFWIGLPFLFTSYVLAKDWL